MYDSVVFFEIECCSFRHLDTIRDIELIKKSTYRTSSE